VPLAELLAELFPGMPAAARLRRLGLLMVVCAFEDGDEPVTAARLAALTGSSASHARRELRALIALGLVARDAPGRSGAVRPTQKARRLEAALLEALAARAPP
jgi:DNA-binding IclR family transcriptional regulator